MVLINDPGAEIAALGPRGREPRCMWSDWWLIPHGVVGGLILICAVLVAVLWLTKPGEYDVKEALRLLPDLVRLIKRLATDPDTPRAVRIRLVLLLAYLAPADRLDSRLRPGARLCRRCDHRRAGVAVGDAERRDRRLGQALAGHARGAGCAETAVPVERQMNDCDPANRLEPIDSFGHVPHRRCLTHLHRR